MNFYRRFIALFASISMLFLMSASSLAAASPDTSTPTFGDGGVYATEEEWRAAVKANIAADLAAQGIVSSIYFPDDPMPLNDINDYKTVVVETKVTRIYGIPGGQPVNGVTFDSPYGGSIYWTPGGGPTTNVSVTLTEPQWGIFSVTVDFGRVPSGVTAYSTNVPGYTRVLLTTNHEYTISGYVTYKNLWVSDMEGWQWVEWARNITPVVTDYKLGYKVV